MEARIEAQMAGLRAGRAFARLLGPRIVRIGGADAVTWLQDLLTADVVAVPVGGAGRSLLLTPTGRIRADLWMLRRQHDVVVVQEEDAGEPIDELLAPFVLSSRVSLEHDRRLELVAGAGSALAGELNGDAFAPSILGAGVDLLVEKDALSDRQVEALLERGLVEVGPEALERWRIGRGTPRMGMDFGVASLPSEVGLDDVIATDKGCFLGQESVARIRNLGHPPTVLRHLRSAGALLVGDAITVASTPVGSVTSACPDDPPGTGTIALARVDWAHREADLRAPDGQPLHTVTVSA